MPIIDRALPEAFPRMLNRRPLAADWPGSLGTKLLFDLFLPDASAALPWSVTIAFGLVLCVVGITGDLVESLLKRDAAVNDTGALLPGMGGVLDRIDAPLLGLPVMYYMMLGYIFFRLG